MRKEECQGRRDARQVLKAVLRTETRWEAAP